METGATGMKALVHAEIPGISGLSYREIEVANPEAGQVRIQLKSAGLNHRDLFVLTRHAPSDSPLIIGSDGAGIVEAVGQDVQNVRVGDEVLINPGLGWKEKSAAPPQGFEILGLPDNGTFAQKIVLPAENVVPKPAYLTWEEAGILSLAALTAYRALFTRGRLKSGMTVLVPGIGSGVATFVLQFAKAAGAVVYVTSRSAEKQEKALALGADKAIDSTSDWSIALGGEQVDLVIESIGAATFNKSLSMLRPGGTIVTFGASAGDEIQINIRNFFYGQYNLLGTTMGSAEEYTEMLDFVQAHQIHPVLDSVYPLDEYEQAFNRMQTATQIGKIGFRIDD